MSNQITEAFTKQFENNIFHLSQQKGSLLQAAVRMESQKGKSKFFERLGNVVAQKHTGRHADTPLIDTPHSRRRVTLSSYKHADLIDDDDKVRMLIDPTSQYAQAFMWAFGRAKDDELIAAMSGNAYSGEEGATAVPLGTGQKIMACDAAGTGSANLNVQALRRAKKNFDANEIDKSIKRYIACTSSQIESLLSETEVTSSDFNTVKALVQGDINTFMGFEFIQIERLVNQSGALLFDPATGLYDGSSTDADGFRKVLCWAEDGMILSVGEEMKTRISEREDKNYSTQVFASMNIGSTRLEDEKVLEILCDES